MSLSFTSIDKTLFHSCTKNASQIFCRFSIILKFGISVFCECSDFENEKGSGDISPPSRFVHLLGVQNLSLRPPAEVNFLFPAIWEIFRIFFISHQIQFVIQ